MFTGLTDRIEVSTSSAKRIKDINNLFRDTKKTGHMDRFIEKQVVQAYRAASNSGKALNKSATNP